MATQKKTEVHFSQMTISGLVSVASKQVYNFIKNNLDVKLGKNCYLSTQENCHYIYIIAKSRIFCFNISKQKENLIKIFPENIKEIKKAAYLSEIVYKNTDCDCNKYIGGSASEGTWLHYVSKV